jgi:hypothetical protein
MQGFSGFVSYPHLDVHSTLVDIIRLSDDMQEHSPTLPVCRRACPSLWVLSTMVWACLHLCQGPGSSARKIAWTRDNDPSM